MPVNFKVSEPYNVREEGACNKFLPKDKLQMKKAVEKFKTIITYSKDDKVINSEIREGVVSIVSQYGSGKSFFLNILYCLLYEDKFNVAYLDISKHEHDKNILKTVLISILKEHRIRSSFREMASKLLPKTIKFFSKQVLKIDDEMLQDISENLGEYFVEIFDEKAELQKQIEKNTKDTPLIIIVDNLDRCRPNFVLYFLSVIKDIFNIKNVLFILAYDKKEMMNAIKTTYGSQVDIQSYVRKYIGAEYYIDRHQNNIKGFIEEYITDNSLQDFEQQKDKIVKCAEVFYNLSAFSLRKMELLLKRYINIIDSNKDNFNSYDKRSTIEENLENVEKKLGKENQKYKENSSENDTEDVKSKKMKDFNNTIKYLEKEKEKLERDKSIVDLLDNTELFSIIILLLLFIKYTDDLMYEDIINGKITDDMVENITSKEIDCELFKKDYHSNISILYKIIKEIEKDTISFKDIDREKINHCIKYIEVLS